MNTYSLSHLSDYVLLRNLGELVAQDRATTAQMLAHIAEVDARKLYLPAAHPSMYAYCVHELRLSEDAAYKRIQAARIARQFPVLFEALYDGRLHLTAVGLLAPHLTRENLHVLLKASARKSKAEIEQLLAERFPRTELLPLVQALPVSGRPDPQLAPAQVGAGSPQGNPETVPSFVDQGPVGRVEGQLAPAQVDAAAPRTKVTPIAPQRFAIQVSVGQATHDKLRHAQALLSHQVPAGDVAQVLDRALDALIAQLEKRKFAATGRPQRKPRPTTSQRHVPAHVKRAVWERDQGQCTFVSESGRRCASRTLLEFDHTDEVARGGQATVDRMRLRCRAHNQYAAECTFGGELMSRKREEARRTAAKARAARDRRAEADTRARVSAADDRDKDKDASP